MEYLRVCAHARATSHASVTWSTNDVTIASPREYLRLRARSQSPSVVTRSSKGVTMSIPEYLKLHASANRPRMSDGHPSRRYTYTKAWEHASPHVRRHDAHHTVRVARSRLSPCQTPTSTISLPLPVPTAQWCAGTKPAPRAPLLPPLPANQRYFVFILTHRCNMPFQALPLPSGHCNPDNLPSQYMVYDVRDHTHMQPLDKYQFGQLFCQHKLSEPLRFSPSRQSVVAILPMTEFTTTTTETISKHWRLSTKHAGMLLKAVARAGWHDWVDSFRTNTGSTQPHDA